MSGGAHLVSVSNRRIDQWLWFARLVKTRSLAARLCAAGTVTLNDLVVRKANQPVRIGDVIAAPQGAYRRTVRVLALGWHRGPASEAQSLYQEITSAVRLTQMAPEWEPLLAEDELED